MKATIDGIACEGTPEEISEFKKLRDAISHHKLWKDLEKKEGAKVDSPFTGKVDTSEPYIWKGKGYPNDVTITPMWQGLTKENEIRCESVDEVSDNV